MKSQLTRQQKEEFVENGFLHIPSAVPLHRAHAALRAINHSIGEVGQTGADPTRYQVDSHCHELRHAPVLTDVFNRTAVQSLTEDLLGPGNMQPVEEVQIAARFRWHRGSRRPHRRSPWSGWTYQRAPAGSTCATSPSSRRLLVDVPAPYSGTTVWPGSTSNPATSFGGWGTNADPGHPDIGPGPAKTRHAEGRPATPSCATI